MEVNRRSFLLTTSSAAVGLLLPRGSYADTGYTSDEYEFLERSVQEQYNRIMQLGRDGKIPLRKMIYTVEPHERQLVEKSWELGIPEYMALGMAVLENGGKPDALSRAGCKGIMQLSRSVADDYGVGKWKKRIVYVGKGKSRRSIVKWGKTIFDHRHSPEKNIDGGLRYLRHLYDDFFPDWDLAVQACTMPGQRESSRGWTDS